MINKIKLQGVRCFKGAEFDFSDAINLIIGRNGSGKTTLIESIGLFAFGSYQSVPRDAFVIAEGEDLARIEMEMLEPKNRSDVAILKSGKAVNINAQKSPNSALVGLLRCVLFNPMTIDLVSGQPSVRRRELDVVIAQKDHLYVRSLLRYRRVIKHRNNLLKLVSKNISKKTELEFWDEQVLSLGQVIYQKRVELIETFNSQLNALHGDLVGRESQLMLRYLPSCDYERIGEELIRTLEDDLRFGQTSIGPHRDDFVFEEGGFILKEGGSRGEQRMAAVAFKIASRDYLKEKKNEPILLLDDIFSELDEKRRESIANILLDGFVSVNRPMATQIFISATDDRVVPDSLKTKAKLIKLD